MLALGPGRGEGDWRRRCSRPSPSRNEGIDEVVDAIDKHRAHLADSGRLARAAAAAGPPARSRRSRWRRCVAGSATCAGDRRLEALADRVAAGELDPYAAADALTEQADEADARRRSAQRRAHRLAHARPGRPAPGTPARSARARRRRCRRGRRPSAGGPAAGRVRRSTRPGPQVRSSASPPPASCRKRSTRPFGDDVDQLAPVALLEQRLALAQLDRSRAPRRPGPRGSSSITRSASGIRRRSCVETITVRPGTARSRSVRRTVSTWT